MLAIFFYALVFGFVFCLSPGAVLAETLRRGLQHGFTPALLVQVGSLVGDAGVGRDRPDRHRAVDPSMTPCACR